MALPGSAPRNKMLRVAKPADSSRLANIFAPYVDSAVTFATDVPSAADFEKKILETLPYFPFLVWEEEGEVIAYAYASKHRALLAYRWCAEVSIYSNQSMQKKGIGSALYTVLLELLRLQGFVNLYAGITLPNTASIRLHEKFGFRGFSVFENIGFKEGAWRDVGWWQKSFVENRLIPPKEPITFSSLQRVECAKVAEIFRASSVLGIL